MSKKLYAAFVPLLAVAAFALVPASSQAAEFHWYSCLKHAGTGEKFSDSECQKPLAAGAWEWVRLPFTSVKTQVVTFGKLTLTASNGIVITCKKVDAGNIWNVTEATAGQDNIEVFVNYECTSAQCATVSVTAKNLPWTSELAAGPVDKIKGIEVTVNCAGTELTFKGELSPKIVNSTETEPLFEEFTATTGELEEPVMKLKAKVEGRDRALGFEHGEDLRVKAP
jgi:hypothetical protein